MTLADAQRPRTGGRAGGADLRRDLAHLQHLIDVMHHHAPMAPPDDRDLGLLAGDVSASTAEQHLRAVGVMLTTLHTYLRGQRPAGPAAPVRAPDRDATARGGGSATDPALAAAAARYIARDLAARRLSEFTSAEGYRLARTLARIGGVEAPVERLLSEANTIRLHPPPLTDAVSLSAG